MTFTPKAIPTQSRIVALLGPTNTGKTYQAIREMLKYETGIIGFPLRLLARENYDRIVSEKGPGAVALVTGEEKIVPANAQYYICTVESMPIEKEFDFVAIDEIQLCADPERGHVFTDRLLRFRGCEMTMFLGADTMKSVIANLVSGVEFRKSPRLSELEYKGYKKLTRLPARTAVVAFSINDVYEMAELIRRQRGGTALVLGALSPRTRNAQVDMYQNGEVDFLVATDAIGMGLNMDIHHIAFASTRKYDGRRRRPLKTAEIAQIAGRAGRYKRDGTFGVTGDLKELDNETVDAVQTHAMGEIKEIYWRNSRLDFTSVLSLLKSLEKSANSDVLIKGYPSDDYLALKALSRNPDIQDMTKSKAATHLLWDVCQIPDFRKTLKEEHQKLLKELFVKLSDDLLSDDYIDTNLKRLNSLSGNVDTLMNRLAHVRTWTYITHRPDWVKRPGYWQGRAHAIEDMLSDALHESLIKRFVDRQSTLLFSKNIDNVNAEIKANGSVYVDDHRLGILKGFSFVPESRNDGLKKRIKMTAAKQVLLPEINTMVRKITVEKAGRFSLDNEGQIYWQADKTNPLPGNRIAAVTKGQSLYRPDIVIPNDDLLDDEDKRNVIAVIREWLDTHIRETLDPLLSLGEEEKCKTAVRGIAFQLKENLGVLERRQVEELTKELDAEDRAYLRQNKVRLGPRTVYVKTLTKPAAVRLKALLWSLVNDLELPAKVPGDGSVSVPQDQFGFDPVYACAIGYPVCGPRAIRVDMLDRIISAAYDGSGKGRFQASHSMAEWMGCSIEELYAVLEGIGFMRIPEKTPPEKTKNNETEEKNTEESKTEESIHSETPAPETPLPETAAPDTARDPEKETNTRISEPLPAQDSANTTIAPEVAPDEAPAEGKAPEPVKPELAWFLLHPRKENKNRNGGKNHKTGNRNQNAKKPYEKKKAAAGKQEPVVELKKTRKKEPDKLKHNPFSVLEDMKNLKEGG